MLRPQFIEHYGVMIVICHTPNLFGDAVEQQGLMTLVWLCDGNAGAPP